MAYNRVQRKIQDSIVKPALQNQAGLTVGIVMNFNAMTKTGDIKIMDMIGHGEYVAHDVPLMMIGGFKQSDPLPGDEVLISYLDSGYRYPVILGPFDSRFTLKTRNAKQSHFRGGGNASEYYSQRKGEYWL